MMLYWPSPVSWGMRLSCSFPPVVARALSRHNVSPLRQTKVLTEYDPKRGVSVATLAYEYPSSYQVPEHAHGSDQLIYAIRGLMEVSSDESVWLIPPHFALWIPAQTCHRIHMPGPVSMRTLYLKAGWNARCKTELRCTVRNYPVTRTHCRDRSRRSSSDAKPLRVCASDLLIPQTRRRPPRSPPL